jgi:hypothetical protein
MVLLCELTSGTPHAGLIPIHAITLTRVFPPSLTAMPHPHPNPHADTHTRAHVIYTHTHTHTQVRAGTTTHSTIPPQYFLEVIRMGECKLLNF